MFYGFPPPPFAGQIHHGPAFTPDTEKDGCITSRFPEAFVDIIGLTGKTRTLELFQFSQICSGIPAQGRTCCHVLLLAASKWSSCRENTKKSWTSTNGLVMAMSTSNSSNPWFFIIGTIARANFNGIVRREPPEMNLPGCVDPEETCAPETVHDISLAQDQARSVAFSSCKMLQKQS